MQSPNHGKKRRAGRVLLGAFVLYGALVATHLGEFWPFSIYPMFSRGGYPWARAVVREMPPEPVAPDSIRWEPVGFEDLPGQPYRMLDSGINQNDLANLISKSRDWSERRVASLERLFGDELTDRTLVIYRADGALNEARMVEVTYTPYVSLSPDRTRLNPLLSSDD